LFNDLSARSDSAINKLKLACNATCAVPTLLPPVRVATNDRSREATYSASDNGLMNPTSLLLKEIARIFPGRMPGVVVSVGCGPPPSSLRRQRDEWQLALGVMQGVYESAEYVAEIESAKWSERPADMVKYCRFSVGKAMANANILELVDFQQVKRLSEEYCRSHREEITSCVSTLRVYASRKWYEKIPFEEDFREIFDAIVGFRFIVVWRLLKRHEEKYSRFDNVLWHIYPRILLNAGLGVERLLRERQEEDEEIFLRTAEITEFLRQYSRERWGHEEMWNTPADPAIHSPFRQSSYPLYPPTEDMWDAIIPPYKAYLEIVGHILTNYYDDFFANRERAESFLRIAATEDSRAQAGILGPIEQEKLRTSSEVVQLLRRYFSQRYPQDAGVAVPERVVGSSHEMLVMAQEAPSNDVRYLNFEMPTVPPSSELPTSSSRFHELDTEILDPKRG
jgi:hypothetical protein